MYFLLGVVTTVSHMAKNCALRLTPNKLYFILNDTAAQGGVTIWCEVNQVCYVGLLTLIHVKGKYDFVATHSAAVCMSSV